MLFICFRIYYELLANEVESSISFDFVYMKTFKIVPMENIIYFGVIYGIFLLLLCLLLTKSGENIVKIT